jgi:hypothetical protein
LGHHFSPPDIGFIGSMGFMGSIGFISGLHLVSALAINVSPTLPVNAAASRM